jgi:hypothetical protein
MEYVNVRENILAPSVLGVLKTILDQTAILVIATRGEGNHQPVMLIMANVFAKRVLTLEMEDNASIVCLGIMDQLAKNAIAPLMVEQVRPATPAANAHVNRDTKESNVTNAKADTSKVAVIVVIVTPTEVNPATPIIENVPAKENSMVKNVIG